MKEYSASYIFHHTFFFNLITIFIWFLSLEEKLSSLQDENHILSQKTISMSPMNNLSGVKPLSEVLMLLSYCSVCWFSFHFVNKLLWKRLLTEMIYPFVFSANIEILECTCAMQHWPDAYICKINRLVGFWLFPFNFWVCN